MNGTFRQSMTWLHTWSGLAFCWILYFMFVTGTLGYLDSEIDHWMQPEYAEAAIEAETYDIEESILTGVRYLEQEAPGAEHWFIFPPGSRQTPFLEVSWQMPEPEDDPEADPESLSGHTHLDIQGVPLAEPRETGGGQLLYRMHYILHYFDRDIAYRFIGIITMLMFVGITTGIVIHKRIFADLFTFRPNKAKRSWLDMHNLTSVSSLPFQIMITYSGLLFMVSTWMPGIAIGSYGFDLQKAQEALSAIAIEEEHEFSGDAAPLTDLGGIIRFADQKWGEENIRVVGIDLPGDANAKVSVSRQAGVAILSDSMLFDGTTGEFLQAKPAHRNAPIAFASTTVGLHEGLFAGPVLRLLYLFSGLLGTAMIATGAIYWTVKRKKKALAENHVGYRFVEALNIGTIMGLPIGIAAYFWANRLLPVGLESRESWEAHVMFLTWAVFLIHPIFRSSGIAWKEQAWCAAIACLSIPAINALTTDAHLAASIKRGDWIMAGFDLTAIGIGISFAITARIIGKRLKSTHPPKKSKLDSPAEAIAS